MVELDSDWMNFHNGDRLDSNDAAGCEQANENQQEREETKMAHRTSCHSVKRFLV
jgi:hypothetical protein